MDNLTSAQVKEVLETAEYDPAGEVSYAFETENYANLLRALRLLQHLLIQEEASVLGQGRALKE